MGSVNSGKTHGFPFELIVSKYHPPSPKRWSLKEGFRPFSRRPARKYQEFMVNSLLRLPFSVSYVEFDTYVHLIRRDGHNEGYYTIKSVYVLIRKMK